MPEILATCGAEIGGSQSEANPGKSTDYLKNKLNTKELGALPKWLSLEFNPQYCHKKRRQKRKVLMSLNLCYLTAVYLLVAVKRVKFIKLRKVVLVLARC
jgi:hypothetical protein